MVQVVSITCTTFVPLLLWVFPRYAAYYAGVDGQWAVLGACLLGLLSAVVHGLLNHRFARSTDGEMLKAVFGELIGKIVAITYVPTYLLFNSVSLFSFSVALKPLLPNTPRFAVALALVLVATMGAMYGIETIGRVASLVFPMTLVVLLVSFTFIFLHGQWSGIFLHPVSVSRSVAVSAQLLPMFFGLNVYLLLIPYYDHRKRNDVWLPVVAVSISAVAILFVYIGSIRIVGYEGLRVLTHPIEFVMQLVQLRDVIIQRFGVVLIFILTMFEAVFFANQMWAVSTLLVKTFDAPKPHSKWFVLAYMVAVLVVFMCIPNQQVWDTLVLRVLVPLSWVYLIIEPVVKLLLAYLLHKGDQ